MSSQQLKSLFISISVMLLALILLVNILNGQGNALGKTYLYLCISAFPVGLMAPKWSFYALIFLSGYIDHFKRLMVSYGRPTEMDVAYILAIPAVMASGIIVATFVKMVNSEREKLKMCVIPAAMLCLFAVAVIAGSAGSVGGPLRTIQAVINQCLYPFLILVIPVYFKSTQELKKMLVYTLVTYVPVALYMFKHHFWGLSEFEFAYLESGLSQEARILTENGGVDGALRGFSTMSGAGIVSVMMSVLPLLCIINLSDERRPESPVFKAIRLALIPIFILAAYYTVSRGGWFCGLAAFAAYFLFATRITTIFAYVAAVAGFGFIVAIAPWAQKAKILEETETYLRDKISANDAYAERAMTLGTANDRVSGLVNLTQMDDLWTPFGWKLSGNEVMQKKMESAAKAQDFSIGHDMVIDTVIKVGYVPMFFGSIFLSYLFYKLHSFMLSLPRRSLTERLVRAGVAIAMGIIFGGFGNAAQLRVFPLNYFVYLFFGVAFSLHINRKLDKKRAMKEAQLLSERSRQAQKQIEESPVRLRIRTGTTA